MSITKKQSKKGLSIYFRKTKRYLLSFVTIVLLKTIIRCFNSNNLQFKKELTLCGYHPAIVNNPYIVLEKHKVNSKLCVGFWVRFVLRFFAFSIKQNCWFSERRQKMLSLLGIKIQYVKHSNLLLKNSETSHYNESPIFYNDLPQGKKVVYSVLIGDYDDIFDPIYISQDCDYILFTDNTNIKSNVWVIKLVQINEIYSQKWNSLYYKILAHKVLSNEYEFSIYIDTTILIHGDIIQLLRYIDNKHPLVMFKNFGNSSIKEEIESLINLKWVPRDKVEELYNNYLLDGFPDNLGQIESGVLIRKHNNESVRIVMEKWMVEITKYPYRDQFCMMYSLWKTNTKDYLVINKSVWDNQFVIHKKSAHKKTRVLFD